MWNTAFQCNFSGGGGMESGGGVGGRVTFCVVCFRVAFDEAP